MADAQQVARSIQQNKSVVAVWFVKQQVEEHLAIPFTDEQWANLGEWFDQSGFADEVEELFYSYVNRAVHEKD